MTLRTRSQFAVAAFALGALAPAQSSVRAWGKMPFDSIARETGLTQVAAGAYGSLVVRADGKLFYSGENSYGILESPTAPVGAAYIEVDCHQYGGIGLLTTGDVVTWGTIPTAGGGAIPFYAPAPPLLGGTVYQQVSMGVRFVAALRSDGAVLAWGYNNSGQCNVPSLQGAVRRLRCGVETAYAVLWNGSIQTWGDCTYGQCQPPPLPSTVAYVDIAEGANNYSGAVHCIALRSDGNAVAWGDNTYGQCNVPVPPSGTAYIAVGAGSGFCVAARSDGVIVGWGLNTDGSTQPPALGSGVTCIQLECGYLHCVGLLSNGQVIAWGNNFMSQAYTPSITNLGGTAGALRFTHVGKGWLHTLATMSDGRVVGFGEDTQGAATPPAALTGQHVVRAEAGVWHSGALTDTGQLFCWGDNAFGKCNVPAPPPGVTYRDFALSSGHTVAIRSDGMAVAFGSNSYGECNIPLLPIGLSYVKCDAFQGKTILLRSDGQVLSWGGSGAWYTQHLIPPLPLGLRYTDVAAGFGFNLVLRSDGEAFWVGPPGSLQYHMPIPSLPPGVSYVEVAAGDSVGLLRRSDGQVAFCGDSWTRAQFVPALEPGASYLQVSAMNDTAAALVGPTSTYVSFATGCAGSLPTARLVPRDTPRIGRPHQLTVFDLPADVCVLAMGFQPLVGIPLASLGMPGCDWHVALDGTVVLVGQDHLVKWQLPIPDAGVLVGRRFYNQALVLDPLAGNAFGAVVSDAAEAIVGR